MTQQWGCYQHWLSLQKAAGISAFRLRLRRMSGPDFHKSDFTSGVLFTSLTIAGSHPVARANFQAVVGDPQTLCFPLVSPVLFS